MNSHSLRLERNARLMLEVTAAECDEMCGDLYGDADNPDMDTVYSASEAIRRFADNLNRIADQLMKEYNTAESLMIDFENEELRHESYRTA